MAEHWKKALRLSQDYNTTLQAAQNRVDNTRPESFATAIHFDCVKPAANFFWHGHVYQKLSYVVRDFDIREVLYTAFRPWDGQCEWVPPSEIVWIQGEI